MPNPFPDIPPLRQAFTHFPNIGPVRLKMLLEAGIRLRRYGQGVAPYFNILEFVVFGVAENFGKAFFGASAILDGAAARKKRNKQHDYQEK